MRCWLVLLAASSAAIAAPDPYTAWRDPIAKVVGKSYDGNALAQLTELGDTFGPRVTGSQAHLKAADWAAAQFRAAGLQNVHFEKFRMEHGWQRGTARAAMITPLARPLHVESQGWAPSTPGTVRGQVVVIDSFDALPPQLAGKIAIVRRAAKSRPGSWAAERKAMTAMAAARAHAVLLEGTMPNNVVGVGAPFTGGKLSPLPTGAIGNEDTAAIVRYLAKGPVTLELQITNTVTGPIDVPNVIGELPGKDRPDEWLLVGAHLDSWDLGTGSSDNGSGAVQVIQAARALAAVAPLRRTIRFALWGGEEQFLVGSHAYAAAHAAELGKCVVAINTDTGPGHVLGWHAAGRADVQAALAPIANHLLASLGGGTVDSEFDPSSDHVSFLVEGVPAIDLAVEQAVYNTIIHRSGDTIDKVDPHGLASGIAVIAVTAYAIAQSPNQFAPRLDRKATEAIVKAGDFDAVMRFEGWWK
jgi:carboxypeptidase Q